MSPSFTTSGYFSITNTNISNTVYANSFYQTQRKTETKKERIKRIAKEKMFASWKTYNQKTESIIEIKQVCKPKHKLKQP